MRSFAKLQFSHTTPLRFRYSNSGWDPGICNFNKILGVSEHAGDLQVPHTYYLMLKAKLEIWLEMTPSVRLFFHYSKYILRKKLDLQFSYLGQPSERRQSLTSASSAGDKRL